MVKWLVKYQLLHYCTSSYFYESPWWVTFSFLKKKKNSIRSHFYASHSFVQKHWVWDGQIGTCFLFLSWNKSNLLQMSGFCVEATCLKSRFMGQRSGLRTQNLAALHCAVCEKIDFFVLFLFFYRFLSRMDFLFVSFFVLFCFTDPCPEFFSSPFFFSLSEMDIFWQTEPLYVELNCDQTTKTKKMNSVLHCYRTSCPPPWWIYRERPRCS